MPVFTNEMYELAKRMRGLTRRAAVQLAMEEYGLSEAGAHAAVAQFIGARSGVVNVIDIEGGSLKGTIALADALTTEKPSG